MEGKKDILRRIYLVYFLICLFGIAVLGKVLVIDLVEGEYWREQAQQSTIIYKDIPAVRGNIYADDGSMLATSIPLYEVRMDLNAEALTDAVFDKEIDSLSIRLSQLFPSKSELDYKRELTIARENGERYHLIRRRVKFTELKKMKTFPLFRKGRYKGGFISTQQNKRERPFRLLAARTIGYDRVGVQPVGIEGAYRDKLGGRSGKRLMQKISGGVWMPINDENEIEPIDGFDVHTTIDINIQDVAENALLEQLTKHDAHHGSVILMEVATGEVKAIANLQRDDDGDYYEYYNYAIGESTEPGSTFKLASLMALMEDGYVRLTDSIDCENGVKEFYGVEMHDSKEGGFGKVTVQRAFEVSSNIGVMKLIQKYYSADPQKFINRLVAMNLDKPVGLEIAGEGKPYVKNPKDESWSRISPLWMSIGYEVEQTPLQTLSLYNAVANNGVLVKPKFVKAISKRGEVLEEIETEVLQESICSESTIRQAQKMLEGVVENKGTAGNLKTGNYKIAGKTGTAQIANAKGYGKKKSYQASFAGYFPADNPKYSCIVVVNAPSGRTYYASHVAGPIFKEIADKVYATSIEIHDALAPIPYAANTGIPVSQNGHQKDLQLVFKVLDVPTNVSSQDNEWAVTLTGKDTVDVKRRRMVKNQVPNVVGMGIRDAVYLLENEGLTVRIQGKGTIKKQSIAPGNTVVMGKEIILQLT